MNKPQQIINLLKEQMMVLSAEYPEDPAWDDGVNSNEYIEPEIYKFNDIYSTLAERFSRGTRTGLS